jgi:hypothetical protein
LRTISNTQRIIIYLNLRQLLGGSSLSRWRAIGNVVVVGNKLSSLRLLFQLLSFFTFKEFLCLITLL